jgi:hypothetical protein
MAPAAVEAAALTTVAGPAAITSAVESSTPAPPKPLSSIAKFLKVPGRIVTVVMKVFDIATLSSGLPCAVRSTKSCCP